MKKSTLYVSNPLSVRTSAVKKSIPTKTSRCERIKSFHETVCLRFGAGEGHGDEESCPPSDPINDGLDSPRHRRSDRSPRSDSHLPCARLNARFLQQPWVGPLACEISFHQICLQ